MTLLETEADPNIRVGPLRWGRPFAGPIWFVWAIIEMFLPFNARDAARPFQANVNVSQNVNAPNTLPDHTRQGRQSEATNNTPVKAAIRTRYLFCAQPIAGMPYVFSYTRYQMQSHQ